jgi:hypothetical protein
MESQQMMELLLKKISDGHERTDEMLKEIRANQVKADADRLRMEDRMEDNRKKDKEDFLAKLDVNQKQTEVMLTKLDAYQEKAEADRKADKEGLSRDRDTSTRRKAGLSGHETCGGTTRRGPDSDTLKNMFGNLSNNWIWMKHRVYAAKKSGMPCLNRAISPSLQKSSPHLM